MINSLAKLQLPPVRIVRSNKRRTMALHVEFNQVRVMCPNHIAEEEILHWLQSKLQWIERKLDEVHPEIKFNHYSQAVDHPSFVWYLGKRYQLQFCPNLSAPWQITPTRIILKKSASSQSIQQLYLTWIQGQAKALMPVLVRHCHQRLGCYQHLPIKSIKFRRTKTKWGHCTHDNQLQFNWIICLAPSYVVEYLICHELCHLLHKNHSSAFWRQLDDIYKQTSQAQQWLRKNAAVLLQA